jgi:hypothetical protein
MELLKSVGMVSITDQPIGRINPFISFYAPPKRGPETHFIINAFRKRLHSVTVLGPGKYWRRWIDTSMESPNDINYWNQAPSVKSQEYQVEAYTIVALISPTI